MQLEPFAVRSATPPIALASDIADRAARSTYADLLGRLSSASVTRHFDAYGDIEWGRADYRIEADDPRFELGADDPLGATAWYRSQPQATRARIGLHQIVNWMKVGVDFESLLSRGLLEFAITRPNGSPEFRYAYHEVIEEGQHSLMFQEFINRSGLDARGLLPYEITASRKVPGFGRTFPERFFVHVLAGEAPIDYLQQKTLTSEREIHPLLARVTRIHVIEEARHICFARRYLEEHVPRMGEVRRAQLQVLAPFIASTTASAMLRTPPHVIEHYAIPRRTVREVANSGVYRERVLEGLRPIRSTCESVGILTPRTAFLWKWLGILPGVTDAA